MHYILVRCIDYDINTHNAKVGTLKFPYYTIYRGAIHIDGAEVVLDVPYRSDDDNIITVLTEKNINTGLKIVHQYLNSASLS